MNNEFPRILSLLRKERHISQKAAAADLGVAQALLSHYEKGKRECGLDFLVKVADYYGVTTDYLLGRSASTTGNLITESDIPDPTVEQEKTRGGIDISLTMSKKLVVNSIDVIYNLLAKIGNSRFNLAIINILNLTVYKVFRIVFRTGKTNSQSMFEIPDECACHYADAQIHIDEAQAASILKASDLTNPEISTVVLESEYPRQSPALLSLIKTSEAQIKKRIEK